MDIAQVDCRSWNCGTVDELFLRICRPSTVYGKHKVKMKVTWTSRDRESVDG